MSLSGSWVEHSVPLKMARSILAPRPAELTVDCSPKLLGHPAINLIRKQQLLAGLSLVSAVMANQEGRAKKSAERPSSQAWSLMSWNLCTEHAEGG